MTTDDGVLLIRKMRQAAALLRSLGEDVPNRLVITIDLFEEQPDDERI